MTFVLVVHHDADLYGADQSLLRSLKALKAAGLKPIVTVPRDGPLVKLMQDDGQEVHIGPVAKLTRQVMRPSAMPKLVADWWRSVAFMQRAVAGRHIELVYTNSISALGGGLWAKLHRVPRLWHVREIVVSPRLAAAGFPLMLRALGGWCVCNSRATRRWITEQQSALATRSNVLWNGLEPINTPPAAAVQAFRQKLGLQAEHTVITLVGRINRWKGQGVLIEAARLLVAEGRQNLRFLIVGDVADDQHYFREDMLAQIEHAGLQNVVLWHPFTPDVHTVWAASDIAVAPSTDPEPFGRVAIEAMAHGLPVVATAHGGLAEIVQHGETGLQVAPGSAPALAQALGTLLDEPSLRQRYGVAGRLRQALHFTQAAHDQQLLALVQALVAKRPPVTTPVEAL